MSHGSIAGAASPYSVDDDDEVRFNAALALARLGPAAGAATEALADALYDGVHAMDWLEHLGPDQTLAVDFVGTSRAFRSSRFGALRVKDAIVDRVREQTGRRPNVDVKHPDVRVHVYLRDGWATVIPACGAAGTWARCDIRVIDPLDPRDPGVPSEPKADETALECYSLLISRVQECL